MFCHSTCCASRPRIPTVIDRGTTALADARDHLIPLALDARDHLVPLAGQTRDRLVPLVQEAAARARPAVESAIAMARPVVATAVTKVNDVVDTEVKPRLIEFLEDVQAEPHIAAVTQHGLVGLVAPAAEPVVEEEPVVVAPEPVAKRRHPVLKALFLGAVVAIVAYAVKTLLGPRDDDWETFDEPAPAEPEPVAEPVAEPVIEHGRRGEEPGDATPPADEVIRPAARVATGDGSQYGPGSYVGPNPPEGYDIKGNAESMKYHVPGALAYNRCVAEVWFNSAEAAEAAGFTRAQR